MAIDAQTLVLSARSLLTSEDTALKLPLSDFHAVVPIALDEWNSRNREMERKTGYGRKILATTASITINAGVATVRSAIEAVGIIPAKVREAEIDITYDGQPQLNVRFVNSRDRVKLTGIQDPFFVQAYFDGDSIYFGTVNGSPLNAVTFTIKGDSNPTDLTNVPEDLAGELAQILAELMRKYNTDSEHKGVQRRMTQK